MNLILSGKDRTADIGAQVVGEAGRLKATGSIGSLAPEHSALRLKHSADLEDYNFHFINLLRMRHNIRTTDYYIPRGPGLRGKVAVALKTVLWKLFRYQHDRITLQQNLINELEINAVEFQRDRLDREVAELKRRIESLEQARAKGAGA